MINSALYTKLSKVISHALRHEPWLYELELDNEGWVRVDELINALKRESEEWQLLEAEDISNMIKSSEKQRHEMAGEKVRALYGHSTPNRLEKVSAFPPQVLFHVTSPQTVDIILKDGLRPMNRQYVHLSVDQQTALEVGKRKTSEPTLLIVQSATASSEGIAFYRGNEKVWLADFVPAQFIATDNHQRR